jgi:hypothetical protein
MKKIKPSSKQHGSTLMVVMSILVTLMVIVGVAAEYSTTIHRSVQRSNTLEGAISIGDGALDLLFANWRTICRATPQSALPTSSFSSIALPTSTMFPSVTGFGASATDYYSNNTPNPPTISNYKVVAADAEWKPLSTSSATPVPSVGRSQTSQTKTTSATYNYIASADVTLPTMRGNVVAKVRRTFQKQQLSPWNFAIFYVDPLEIHPGPSFTVTGWVHTNSDLYTGHSSLTFADKVTYASDWFTWSAANPGGGFKPGDLTHASNDPANGAPDYMPSLPPARDIALQPFGLDSTGIFNTTDTNPNNDSYRELVEPPSGAASTDPLAGERYWDQASVIIRINADNSVSIGYPDPANNYAFTAVTSSNWRYTMFNPAVSTNQTIQDNREGAQIRLATLDLNAILTSPTGTPAYKSSNFNTTPIVYIYDASATSSARRGIRLKNGSRIPANGLTVASNNPVYIQGDFNTGGTGSAVPSNNPANFNSNGTYVDPANPPSPEATGYNRAPCSILADAVNILSNSWNDANAGTVPAASPTTVNTAIVSGIVPTAQPGGDGSYSGGAENFPRFLENWSNKTLTYYGSMIELYKSAQSIGEWGKANVYSPPAREWFFDSNFKFNPPPGTLMVYSYIKGKWSML